MRKQIKEIEKELGSEQIVTSSDGQEAAELGMLYDLYKAVNEFSEMKDVESDGKNLLSKYARDTFS